MIRQLRLPRLVIIVFLVALSSAALISGGRASLNPTITPIKIIKLTSTTQLLQNITLTPRKIRPTSTRRPVQKITLTPISTSTPGKIKPTPTPPITQTGNSDRIVLIGILIVGIIIVPILLRRKEWR